MILEGFLERRNSQSTWVHSPSALIPTFDNLLYILALFQTRQVSEMQEAKRLFTHLMHFEIEGKFPTYLHNYPYVKVDPRLLLPLTLIDREFHPCGDVIGQLLAACYESDALKAYRGEAVDSVSEEVLLFSTLHPEKYCRYLESVANQYIEDEAWVGAEKVDSLQRIMIEYAQSKKVSRWTPELVLLPNVEIESRPIDPLFIGGQSEVLDIALQNQKHFTCFRKEFTFEASVEDGVIEAEFTMTRPFDPQDCKNSLISFYLNQPHEAKIFVNGVRAMTFRSKDLVRIETKEEAIELKFEASDRWMGHILRSNRPTQKVSDKFCAYDLEIGLRSVYYEEKERVSVQLFSPFKVGLSTASPIACIP